ncbi:hypothetical protein FDP41_006297 [Naegleria fowleri]|uniref:BTB domain-containing protein n=1 Tax=Naegleria fowleri TaxID=5763 RepID=A0A6A5B9H7_NAEFO|nr:uncharacterized protein FDP41_006297 [Naegleria fowleri]KAF0974823.1 hypothetical protein FDP41_006297 [Naegleria fowleri]
MFNHHHARSHTPPTTSHLLSSSPPLPSSSSSCSLQPLIHHHVTPSSTTPLNSSSPPIPFPSSSFSPFDRNCDSALNQQHLMHHHQQILLVDVGGQVFKTTRETLCKYEGYFTAYFRFLDHQNVEHGIMNHEKQSLENSTNHGNHAHSNHHYIFLDRNPEMFKIILSCLRVDRTQIEDCLPMDEFTLKQLYNESLYFSINELSEIIERKLFRKKKFGSVGVGFDKSKYISFVICEGLNSKTSNQLSAPNTISEVYKVLHDNGCTVEHTIYRKAVESNIDSRIFPTDSFHKKAQIVTIIVSYID